MYAPSNNDESDSGDTQTDTQRDSYDDYGGKSWQENYKMKLHFIYLIEFITRHRNIILLTHVMLCLN